MADSSERAPLDIGDVDRSLAIGRHAEARAPQWLRDSYREPRAFCQALSDLADWTAPSRLKSRPDARFDLYSDAITRNASLESPAFRWRLRGEATRSWTFVELAQRVGRRVTAWERAGVERGSVIAIVRRPGPELAVSILATWRMGGIVAVVPPLAQPFVARRLLSTEMAFVDVESTLASWVGELAPALPPELPSDAPPPGERSVAYESGEVAALVFDPRHDVPWAPVPVTADALFLGALREGLVSLGLRRSDVLATFGQSELLTWPVVPLAAWMAGAAYHHVAWDDLRRQPEWMAEPGVAVAGVALRARELAMAQPQDLGSKWRLWYRSPSESADVDRWQRFADSNGLYDNRAANLEWSPMHGGATLFSVRREGQVHSDVFPVAGVVHRFEDFLSAGTQSPTGHGNLAYALPGAAADETTATHTIIAPLRGGWAFAGSMVEGGRGVRYLVEEVTECLDGLPSSLGVSACLVPLMSADRVRVDLIVFTSARAAVQEADLTRDIRERIAAAVGDAGQPDRIVVFRLVPRRREDGQIDADWVKDQYLTGGLGRRARDPLQADLTKLAEAIATAGTPSTAKGTA